MWLLHELGDFWVSTKTDSSSVAHCKVHINLIPRSKCLISSTKVANMVCFVLHNSHGFSFVLWGATCLQKKKWPFMNQFFESLYIHLWTWSFHTIFPTYSPLEYSPPAVVFQICYLWAIYCSYWLAVSNCYKYPIQNKGLQYITSDQATPLTRPLTLTHSCIFWKIYNYYYKSYLIVYTKFWGEHTISMWLPGRMWPAVIHQMTQSALKQVSSLILHSSR